LDMDTSTPAVSAGDGTPVVRRKRGRAGTPALPEPSGNAHKRAAGKSVRPPAQPPAASRAAAKRTAGGAVAAPRRAHAKAT